MEDMMGGGESGLRVMLGFKDHQSKTVWEAPTGANEHGKGVTPQALVEQQQKSTF